jgi:arabinose-5-phosphate isomerase
VARQSHSVRRVFIEHSRAGRRTGAIMLVDSSGKLAGLFTDSDLARLFERNQDAALDRPIREVMTASPLRVPHGSMALDAIAIMAERKISELPVVDDKLRPVGLIDVTDVVALFPEARGVAMAAKADGPSVARLAVGSSDKRARPRTGAPPRECA